MPQSGVVSMQGKDTGNMPNPMCAFSMNKSLDPTPISDGPFSLRKLEVGLYGVLKSEFQTHKVGIVPNLGLFRPSEI